MLSRALITVDGVTVGKVTFGPSDEVELFEPNAPALGGSPIGTGVNPAPRRSLGGNQMGSHGPSRHLDPANRPQAKQAPHVGMHRHHHGEIDTATFGHDADKHDPNKGPTFRPHMTPRNGHEPAHPEHFSLGDVQSAAKGDNNLRGSAYLQHERSWIKDELDKDPSLQRYLRGVLAHEQSPGERSKVMESLANRLNLLRKT